MARLRDILEEKIEEFEEAKEKVVEPVLKRFLSDQIELMKKCIEMKDYEI